MSGRPPLQSDFVRKSILFLALLSAVGCANLPGSYPPPAQHRRIATAGPGGLDHYVVLSNPQADRYFVRDISPSGDQGGWRWAWSHPELRFYLPTAHALSFEMEFVIPDSILHDAGPVTLALRINGRPFAEFRVDKGGKHHFLQAVPDGLLFAQAVNTVSIEPDKIWRSKQDGQALSFLLGRAGFVD